MATVGVDQGATRTYDTCTLFWRTLTSLYDENNLRVSHLQPKCTKVISLNVSLILANANTDKGFQPTRLC